MAAEITEKAFFFPGSGHRQLYAMLHTPSDMQLKKAWLYCHPFAEEKNCSHAIITQAAREMARAGQGVLRFDLSGCGDSQGELMDMRLRDWHEDVEHALTQLRSLLPDSDVGIWGLRFGAALALRAAKKAGQSMPLMLWQPVLDAAQCIRQFLRQKLAAEIAAQGERRISVKELIAEANRNGSIEVNGYVISAALIQDFLSTSPVPVAHGETEIVSIAQTEKSAFQLRKLVSDHPMLQLRHVRCEPFWDRYWRWQAPELMHYIRSMQQDGPVAA